MNISILTQFIDANRLGGWVRAGVASLLAVALGKWPLLASFLDPITQQALGIIAASLVVGVWSQLTKTDTAKLAAVAALSGPQKQAAFAGIPDSAKIAAVEALPDVTTIDVKASATGGVADALNDPARPKVVSASDVSVKK